ncbi:hypothetical protein PSI9734_01631 [Pseudidiomarina piscicola]|uniref:Uncharacterized protein n=1 Tax=Pseudidiomarina piscicola TaxID=2614830 RepID=A0A6S6WRZ7_9GAMM|nr:hypothetical protein [Pseudidiomarina piscicola]CAB0151218.1 hypothetical protein PSI9734_01631 [Pseudidiomarina piscicola]VZT40724.1 hypothetical protein PSI9734_01631 [Pseudomonas aeruginosa]
MEASDVLMMELTRSVKAFLQVFHAALLVSLTIKRTKHDIKASHGVASADGI